MLFGTSNIHNFLIRILWSIKSKALRYSNKTVLIVALFLALVEAGGD